MISINKLWTAGLVALLLIIVKPAITWAQPGYSVSFQTFYDELAPYGTWIDDPDYGSVWVPNVDDGFRPYATNGYWAMTDYGNTWVSNYDWGWAAFHYGRWRFDDYYGWEWIPDTEWGPAWVNWRTGGGYYAWAPLGPGISLDIAFGDGYYIPDDYWICAPSRYINSPYVYNYYVPRERVVTVIHSTTIINNVYVVNNTRFAIGPRPIEIQRYTHRPVTVLQINNVTSPGVTIVQNRTVNIYRPTVIKVTDDYNRPRPAVVVDANAYRNAHPYNGIANHTNGATVNHTNAAILSQTASSPQAQNNGFVHVNRPAPNNAPANGNSPANNNYDPQHRGNRPLQGNPALAPPVNTAPTTAPASTPAPTNTAPATAPAYGGGGYYRRARQTAPATTNPAPTSTPAVTPSQPQAQPQTTQPQAQPQRQPGQYYRRTQPQQQPQSQPQQSQPAPQQQPQRTQPQPQTQPAPQQQQPQKQQPAPQQPQKPHPKPQPRPVRKDVPPPTVQS